MRLVRDDSGVLELRWTWLPYWLVVGPALQEDVNRLIKDAVLLNGLPTGEDSLDRLDRFVARILVKRFPLPGFEQYLEALQHVQS